ncbi:MAG: hypothetical protein C0434_07945 [Xanthomonadaceae bacterium]|nr:hypothetical protein [Xanthomonadaceae bacterium]
MNAVDLLSAPMSAPEQRECAAHGPYPSRQIGQHWTGCPTCFREALGRLREQAHRELVAQQRADRAQALLATAGIPPRFEARRLEEFAAAGQKAGRWLDRAASGDPGALAIMGPVGTGKTALSCALVRAACERGVVARYCRTVDLRDRTRAAWDGSGSEANAMAWFTAPRILVVDEIGLGGATASDVERLHAMLDRRYMDAVPTVIVTNLDSDGIRAAIGERARDRLRDGATTIRLLGESRREPRGAA